MMTVCSSVDVVKTQVMSGDMNQSTWKVIRQGKFNEGYMWILKGWLSSCIRLGPQTILTMVFLEQCKKLYLKLKAI